MSEIDIRYSASRAATGTGARSGQRRINTVLFWFLVAAVILAPLPLGSARAFFWGIWALYVGVAGAVYCVALTRLGENPRVNPASLGLSLVFLAVPLYLVVQMLPLSGVLGSFAVVGTGADAITTPTISIAPTMTALMLARQLTYGIFFILVLQVAVNDQRRATLLNVLLIAIVAYAAYGLVSLQSGDTILGLPKWAYLGSATGPFVNRNSFATFLAFGSVIALARIGQLLIRQGERHRDDGRIQNNTSAIVLAALCYMFLVATIVATQSRMGLFASAMGGLVVVALIIHALGTFKAALYIMPVVIVVLSAALFLFGEGLFERVGSLDSSLNVRLGLYRQVLDMIAIRPWTGFGGGTFELAYPLVHEVPVNPDLTWDKAHNSYLSLWAELGLVVGSLPIIAVGFLAIRMFIALARGEGSWTAQTVAVAAVVIAGLHSLVDFSLEIEANALLFLAILAAGAAKLDRKARVR